MISVAPVAVAIGAGSMRLQGADGAMAGWPVSFNCRWSSLISLNTGTAASSMARVSGAGDRCGSKAAPAAVARVGATLAACRSPRRRPRLCRRPRRSRRPRLCRRPRRSRRPRLCRRPQRSRRPRRGSGSGPGPGPGSGPGPGPGSGSGSGAVAGRPVSFNCRRSRLISSNTGTADSSMARVSGAGDRCGSKAVPAAVARAGATLAAG